MGRQDVTLDSRHRLPRGLGMGHSRRWFVGLSLLAFALPAGLVAAEPTEEKHWSFQPVQGPPAPTVRDVGWVRNPLDAFVLARLEARNWKPAPPAPPAAFFRRLYLDLIGLPPSLDEQARFLREA